MPLSDEWDALDAYMADPEAYPLNEPDDPDPEPPRLASTDDVNRLLRSLASLGRQEAAHKEAVKAEMERLTGFSRDRLAGIERRRKWFAGNLDGFMRAYAAETRTKTLTLSNGVLEIRPPSPSVADLPEEVIDGLADEVVNRKPTLNKAAVQSLYKPGPIMANPVTPEGEVIGAPSDVAVWETAIKDGRVVHVAVDKTTLFPHPTLRFLLDPEDRFNWRTT